MAENEYIFNTNHNRTHYPGCRAVTDMMAEKHKLPVDEPRGHLCGWCFRGTGLNKNQVKFEKNNEDSRIGAEICTDPAIRNLFKKAGCLNGCGNLGDIKMFPDESGIEVSGLEGKFWVYFECYECGYQTAWWKALHKIQVQEQAAKRNHAPVKVI